MILKHSILSLLGLFLLLLNVAAYWRMPCMGVVGRGRIDPIVSPGKFSAHEHTIKGASGISLDSTVEDLLASDCTSCQIAQDKSAYWSPTLHLYDTDAKEFIQVEEVSGHLTYYKYVPHTVRINGVDKYTMPIAPPNGLKMLSGNPFKRNFTLPVPDPPLPWTGEDATQEALKAKAIGFNCLGNPAGIEGTLQRHFLPDKAFLENNCPNGIRAEVLFPTCWNGKDLAPEDLTSHMAYGDAGANGGRCPETHPVVIMQLLFETIYPTGGFKDKNGFFTFAQGDPTGYGYHGDVMVAWEGTTLEDAVEDCGDPTPSLNKQAQDGVVEHCNHFSIVPREAMSSCTMQATGLEIKANFQAMSTALPGNNVIQYGPMDATTPASGEAATVPVPTALPSTLVPTTQSVALRSSDSSNAYANQFLQKAPSTTASAAASTLLPTTTSSLAPLVTNPPSPLEASLPDNERILNTATYTSNGAVYEVVNVEIVRTTTVWDNSSRNRKRDAEYRRHVHQHNHHRRHN